MSKFRTNFNVAIKYDERGNYIYGKLGKYEECRKYDSNNNCIHYKDSYGVEYWYEYDDRGNEIHFKTSTVLEIWREYDNKGNCIHYKDSKGYEEKYYYDEYCNFLYGECLLGDIVRII